MTGIELKEAITELEFVVDRFYDFPEETGVSNNINNVQNAIKAIKELEDYYAIGTVERFQQLSEQFKPHMADETSCPERNCNKCDRYRKENEEYRKIGTFEECREARERDGFTDNEICQIKSALDYIHDADLSEYGEDNIKSLESVMRKLGMDFIDWSE